MPAFDLDAWVVRSKAIDLSSIDWAAVPRYPVSPETARTLRYMQDIESHTIVYTRSLLATRAIDDRVALDVLHVAERAAGFG